LFINVSSLGGQAYVKELDPNRKTMLLLNKSDLLTPDARYVVYGTNCKLSEFLSTGVEDDVCHLECSEVFSIKDLWWYFKCSHLLLENAALECNFGV
jgi:hypothetical protein